MLNLVQHPLVVDIVKTPIRILTLLKKLKNDGILYRNRPKRLSITVLHYSQIIGENAVVKFCIFYFFQHLTMKSARQSSNVMTSKIVLPLLVDNSIKPLSQHT